MRYLGTEAALEDEARRPGAINQYFFNSGHSQQSPQEVESLSRGGRETIRALFDSLATMRNNIDAKAERVTAMAAAE